ncbi:Tox-REase-5 domain-containing protein [Haloglycomyces albus]|uniref:Tox-REase-5 domain-containing protein n=1 Tax=Haloglycomyces albus TaxID=526067 RepID=UPI00146FC40E|nr:Tox-REase-5 domain-containing protein [Haloglycomyces albus]
MGGKKPGGAKPNTQAWYYEQQIKGDRPGKAYWVPYPETREKPGFDLRKWVPSRLPDGSFDGVAFDGWDRQKKELLDAKGARYAYLLDEKNAKWSKAADQLKDEAKRQQSAAKGTGASIRWHFAETAAEQRMKRSLKAFGVKTSFTEPKHPSLFSAPGSPSDKSGKSRQTGAAPRAKSGGIDFSTLQLQYLSESNTDEGSGVSYSFKNSIGPNGSDLESARLASDAFFVWLELDPSRFWVNLHPDQPDRIIDPELARTDVGKILLEADVELKRSMIAAMDPETDTGYEFWERIFTGPDDDTCFWVRNWISPEPASVRVSGDELHILDAPLKVETATQDDIDDVCPGQTKERQEYNEAAINELILPEVEEMVNNDPEYADLRRVYLSRVAAEWYKDLSAEQDTHFGELIGEEIIGPWESREPWDPMDSFNEMLELLDSAEGSIVIDGVTYHFTHGGVDFSQSPSTRMSEQRFNDDHPNLPETVQNSLNEPTVDADDDDWIWLGGHSIVADAPEAEDPSKDTGQGDTKLPVTGLMTWQVTAIGLAAFTAGFVVLFFLRRRKSGPTEISGRAGGKA